MTIENTPFLTRARTIDHLGREQIADCPTAISELWKNSYDAYARNVSLNIFDGDLSVAALVDDGHGMDKAEFISKWLVVGTESKATGPHTSEDDRDGLPIRPRQGQKGIGRLSCATMGSLLLLLSKRKNCPFVAALIDWRIFENPFLLLNDVQIPVVEFASRDDLPLRLPGMFDALMSNLWGSGKEEDAGRDSRLIAAWAAYEQLEKEQGKIATTKDGIEKRIIESCFESHHLEQWPVWTGDSPKGTALFVTGISDDLLAYLSLESAENDESINSSTKRKFFETLSGFTDPYSRDNEIMPSSDFSTSVVVWNGRLKRIFLDRESSFSVHDLDQMEHFVEGAIDESGTFRGRLRAFGRDFPQVEILPFEPTKTTPAARVGPFSIRIATFEIEPRSTTHAREQHGHFVEMAERYAAFMLHRDGFRIMPYGREENDYFQIEMRRSKNAGEAFWSARRTFGGVKISRDKNPNLRDKAGREGLIDNKAAKQFRQLVTNLLAALAKKYFGRSSDIRNEILPEIRAEYEKKKLEEGRGKLINRQRNEVRAKIRENSDQLDKIVSEVEQLTLDLVEGSSLSTEAEALSLRRLVSKISNDVNELALGPAPASLGSLKNEYTDYKRQERKVSAMLAQANNSISVALERFNPKTPEEIIQRDLQRNAAYLSNRIRKWGAQAEIELKQEQERLRRLIEGRHQAYHKLASYLVADVRDGKAELADSLRLIEEYYQKCSRENEDIFPPYINVLKSLRDQIDLEGLVNHSIEESSNLRDEIARVHALAQLGITVEIIGHEIEDLDLTIERGLNAMPIEVRSLEAFQRVQTAHHSLSDRWRFLSPLKLSGEKIRMTITGASIAAYVTDFFSEFFDRSEILLVTTDSFKRISFDDMPSRIFPVFVNLVNNARYWVKHSKDEKKVIRLDFVNGKVIVADNGPGVDAEDVTQLFTLFFTKKASGGRGVGLYLCRANLAAGGHKIYFETDAKNKILSGANFSIEFLGVRDV